MALKKRGRARLRLTGNDCPTVDVFVTCCGEEDEVIIDTVRGALDQDYPPDRFRVIVLDDGQSASLEAAINQMTINSPNLFYMAREKIPGKPHFFKAGNLNYGLEQANLLPSGAGQFMAALDADMVSLSEHFPMVSSRSAGFTFRRELLTSDEIPKISLIQDKMLTTKVRFLSKNGFALCFPTY